jgi:hypothetical protein
MIPRAIPTDPARACELSSYGRIHHTLALKLIYVAARLPYILQLISGHRSMRRQVQLELEGRPAADPGLSTHTSCPATGADVWPSVAPTNYVKALLGEAATLEGLRWGGGSPVDPETGIPSDWNHLDLGRRYGH